MAIIEKLNLFWAYTNSYQQLIWLAGLDQLTNEKTWVVEVNILIN